VELVRAHNAVVKRPLLFVPALVAVVLAAALAYALFVHEPPAISVYPSSRTLAAGAATTVTVRGAGADELGDVSVTGSRSGAHPGRWTAHPDGDGAAFVPDEPFTPGERVTVDAGRPVAGADGDTSSFGIADALDAPTPPFDEAKPATDEHVQAFKSRPDLRPPAVRVRVRSAAATEGDVFVAPKRGATQVGPMILDDEGGLVWFHPLSDDAQAFDFRTQTYRGAPVLTWWEGKMRIYRGAGVGRIVDTAYREVATVRAGNGYELDGHEFQLTPQGTALLISYVPVPWDLSELGGRRDGIVEDNVIQEVDVETGAVLFEWHALGTIALGESYRAAPTEAGLMHDPFHVNSVALDDDGDFIVSARHDSAVFKIDRETGEVVWRLGGKESDFALDPGARFNLQHDARRRADGAITLFDNVSEDVPANGRRSRALALSLDEQAMTAKVAQWWEHPGDVLSGTQGSAQNLPDGHMFVGWGGLQPWFSEFSADGRPVFDAGFVPKGVESYRAYRGAWDGTGDGEPSAAMRNAGGKTTVYASWNGASDVATWRATAADGDPVSAPRTGFETAIELPGTPAAATVEALDADGRVLGKVEAASG
jgi:hypothetical protein